MLDMTTSPIPAAHSIAWHRLAEGGGARRLESSSGTAGARPCQAAWAAGGHARVEELLQVGGLALLACMLGWRAGCVVAPVATPRRGCCHGAGAQM